MLSYTRRTAAWGRGSALPENAVIVALDATPLTIGTGGVSRYTRELSQALAKQFPIDQYYLCSDQPFPLPSPTLENLRCASGPRNAMERRWWLWGIRKSMERAGATIFHGTDFSVPYTRSIASVMTLHDLSPWLDLDWQPDAGRIRRRTPRLIRRGFARKIITPTSAIRRAAINRFQIDPANIVAIPHAPTFPPSHGRDRSQPPYFLFVGTLEPRKNVSRMIDAWRAAYAKSRVPLWIAGRVRSDFAPPRSEPGLHMLGAVPDEDLPRLYANALAVAYVSEYEGFGLPVLEAMAQGALVVASRDPAIVEVAGDGNAIHVDARDTRAIAEALSAIAENPARFEELRIRARARAGQFSWESTARQTREVYESVAQEAQS